MAGYGLKSFLIAQSLNQIEKAYGPNNAILDNCHVRVAFATNDERTAKRVSDALGTATELRAMKNYAGHRLALARPSHGLTPGDRTAAADARGGDAIGCGRRIGSGLRLPSDPRKKARYYEDRQLKDRMLPPPKPNEMRSVIGRLTNGASGRCQPACAG